MSEPHDVFWYKAMFNNLNTNYGEEATKVGRYYNEVVAS